MILWCRKIYKPISQDILRMVLESLINPSLAESKPGRMFFIGMFYGFLGISLAWWIFRPYASLVAVFLTVLAWAPLMYNTLKLEEEKDLKIESEPTLLKEHGRALLFFMMVFLGITVAFTLVYILMPQSATNSLFHIQQMTIAEINGRVTTHATQDFQIFSKILLNNVKVLVFCVIFAFVYGFGAAFILVWNASVIATAMGEFFRQKLGVIGESFGYMVIASYFSAGMFSVIRYAPHGVLEILAYFIAGLAGGIISVAVIRHDFGTHKFEKIVFDAANLLIIAFGVLFIAAFVETFITPLFFA